jgi:hypothetical protein
MLDRTSIDLVRLLAWAGMTVVVSSLAASELGVTEVTWNYQVCRPVCLCAGVAGSCFKRKLWALHVSYTPNRPQVDQMSQGLSSQAASELVRSLLATPTDSTLYNQVRAI